MDKETKRKETFPVMGMSCASCAARVSKTLNSQHGVYEANVNYAAATAQVVYNPEECSAADLRLAVREAGYDLLTDSGADEKTVESEHEKEYRLLRRQTIAAIALAVPILVMSMFSWTQASRNTPRGSCPRWSCLALAGGFTSTRGGS